MQNVKAKKIPDPNNDRKLIKISGEFTIGEALALVHALECYVKPITPNTKRINEAEEVLFQLRQVLKDGNGKSILT